MPGSPDLRITDAAGALVTHLEVTGSECMRGNGYWVRPDKIEWARAHHDEPLWVALHYAAPKETFLFFKPNPHKLYPVETQVIRGARERYAVIGDEDVIDFRAFRELINGMADDVALRSVVIRDDFSDLTDAHFY